MSEVNITKQDAANAFANLLVVMDELREQCPWDQKQTIHTLRNMTIEEVYELVDAIDHNNWKEIEEELGDVLLHFVFYSRIGEEEKKLDAASVINLLIAKLKRRHPHIYDKENMQQELKTAEDVKANWEKVKLSEGKKSVLEGVPKALPALMKSLVIQKKVKQVGFEWKQTEDVWNKVEEEMAELESAVESGNEAHQEEEMGDLIFALINYCRFLKIDPEKALEKTNQKFIDRFKKMEVLAFEGGSNIAALSLEDQEQLWQKVKKQ